MSFTFSNQFIVEQTFERMKNFEIVKKEIDPFPAINHKQISYLPIEKKLYTPHDEIQNASKTQINKLLGEIGIRIQGIR